MDIQVGTILFLSMVNKLKVTRIIYLLLFISKVFISSCNVSKSTRNSFTNCYDNVKTGLNHHINLKGIYKPIDSSLIPVQYIFYSNSFTRQGSSKFWRKEFLENSKFGTYGKYHLSVDTIKIQYITSPNHMSYGKIDVWFKIIDNTTLEMIYYGSKQNITKQDLEEFKVNNRYSKNGIIHYKFHTLDKVPDIDKSYIMNKKWFWCNEEDYMKWKSGKK